METGVSISLYSFPSTVLPVVEETLGVHIASFLHSFSKFGHPENMKLGILATPTHEMKVNVQ